MAGGNFLGIAPADTANPAIRNLGVIGYDIPQQSNYIDPVTQFFLNRNAPEFIQPQVNFQATYDPFMAIAAMQRPTVQQVTNPVFGGVIPMNFGVPAQYNPYGVQQYNYDGPMYVAGSSYRPPPVQQAPLPVAPVTPDVPYAPANVVYEGPTYTPGQTVRANEAAAAEAAAATPPPEVVQQQYQQQVTQSLGYNPYATGGGEVYAGPFVVPSEPVESLDQYYIQTLGWNPLSQSGGSN